MKLDEHRLALARWEREPKCGACGRPEIWHTERERAACPVIFW